MRIAYIVELDPREITSLAFVAGMLQGQGIQQGASLAAMLDRIQAVEVPDDFGTVLDEELGNGEGSEASEDVESGNDNVVSLFDVIEDSLEREGFEPIDVATDPTAPENLGIQLELPAPPPPPGPMNHPSDFGAGPPPRSEG